MKIEIFENEWDHFKELCEKAQERISLFYPKRIVCPNGYYDPKYYSLVLGIINSWFYSLQGDTDQVIKTVTNNLIDTQVPTYFIDHEFLLECVATVPPQDFSFSEVYLPLKHFILVFPTQFVESYLGWRFPFIGVSLVDKGDFVLGQEVNVGTLCFHLPFLMDSGRFVNYAAWYPTNMPISTVGLTEKEGRWEDVTKVQELMYELYQPKLYEKIKNDKSPSPSSEEEQKILIKAVQATILTLMVWGTSPKLIKPASLERPEKKAKTGEIKKEALWSPNIVGYGYKIEHESPSLGGHHASPRMHWRRKSLVHQPHGPEGKLRKLIWRRMTLVKKPEL